MFNVDLINFSSCKSLERYCAISEFYHRSHYSNTEVSKDEKTGLVILKITGVQKLPLGVKLCGWLVTRTRANGTFTQSAPLMP